MTDAASSLQYDTLRLRRPGLTRDLPPGAADLQWVSNTSTLVFGERDAVLVGTFLTIEQNQQLVEWVKAHDRNLAYVFITHGHGDHAFGVKQLLEAFPEARPVAAAVAVAKSRSEGTAPFIDSFWAARFPGQVPQPQVFPQALDGDTFTILAALDPVHVVAGHKNPDLPDDPQILAQTKRYFADFNRLDAETTTHTELYEAMLALYPERANPGPLWGGAKRAKGVS